jgi:hypothetical protein
VKDVSYFTNGDGKWFKREWREQCPEDIFLGGRCQGVKGHDGEHWCYNLNGNYQWEDNENDLTKQGCSGFTPPGHEKYVNPVDTLEKCYLNNYVDSEVTNPELIARLEAGEIDDGESTIRPV